MKLQRLLSINEVTEHLPVCRRTVEKLVWDGKLPSVKIGRRTFIEADDLAAFIEACRTNGKEPR